MTDAPGPEHAAAGSCPICGKAAGALLPVAAVGPGLAVELDRLHPGWREGPGICRQHVIAARRAHVQALLQRDRDEISKLDTTVAEAISRDQSLVATLGHEGEKGQALGDRVADRVARFGGSWRFILGFTGFLVLWITANALLAAKAVDPFPFILLNLVLSCVAALQAPFIMMSQQRQEAKDRTRAENDYLVNLKAELEIRLLHEKIDHLLLQQLDHMQELQALILDDRGGDEADEQEAEAVAAPRSAAD